jgi:uncharacterized cupredoxin-like copper-binding protein
MLARLFESTLRAVLFCGSCASFAAAPAQTLEIKLQDVSTDPAIVHMRMTIDHDALKPGRITFETENQSKTLVHEVLVARDTGAADLPFDAKANRVIEKRVHSLGEISDVAPGKRGKLTLNLKAGKYILFCNQPGHYKDGMLTKLTVAP